MGCVKGPATLGIDNISLMQACVNRGSVMDPLPLTDDGYCGLKFAKKKRGTKKKGVRVVWKREEGCGVVIDLAHRS